MHQNDSDGGLADMHTIHECLHPGKKASDFFSPTYTFIHIFYNKKKKYGMYIGNNPVRMILVDFFDKNTELSLAHVADFRFPLPSAS